VEEDVKVVKEKNSLIEEEEEMTVQEVEDKNYLI